MPNSTSSGYPWAASLPSAALDVTGLGIPWSLSILGLITFVSVAVGVKSFVRRKPEESLYPAVNKTKEEYLFGADNLIAKGLKEYGGKPFRILTGIDSVTLLGPRFADDIRNDPRLSSSEFLLGFWQADTPGFEPHISSGSNLLRDVVKTYLTPGDLAKWSKDLSDEAAAALKDVLGEDEEWHEISLGAVIPTLVARVSSLLFLGPELCRDPDWLRVTINYPNKGLAAARVLRTYPRIFRKIVHWFLPCCQELRQMLKDAESSIQPILQRRREQEAEGAVFHNALSWFEKMAERKQDATAQSAAFQQLGLSILANASSTDLVSQNILDICQNSDLIEPLREEIERELGDGWKTSTLFNMKLLDSVLKETLRLKPIATVGLGRIVKADDFTLSDGSYLPKGTAVAISSERMWDPAIYPEPRKYDGYRFMKLRESGDKEGTAQLCSVSLEHVGFGLGRQACPGRFMGASSTKLIMCNLLQRYDIKLPESAKADAAPLRFGFSQVVNPKARVMIRRRKVEASS
ncbi:cytochrome p450 monooxygenase [Colletotrichum sojae]|uniref:Cytochrome p450 monooxygenase n=1 Tax=Colletotrichum sojae TaxID=2175907 RepID=A0A8H6IQS8_9PEZI|nr:cytochrome p450 monooxygenase [Colletotrichum sojae]